MADIAITPTLLVLNTKSADITDADGTAIADAAANQFVVAAGTASGDRGGDRLILKFLAPAGGDTVVITAGDRPPALRKDLGDLTLTMAANDVAYICVEESRFLQSNGTIIVTCSDNSTEMKAFVTPRGN